MKMRATLLLILLLNSIFCWSQLLKINIEDNHFKIDTNNALIISHIDHIEFYKELSHYSEIIVSFNKKDYHFNVFPENLNYKTSYLIHNSTEEYTLYFTEVPIVSIESQNTIPENPKVGAKFTYVDENQTLVSNIHIESRGGFSKSFPKKTYHFNFLENTGNVLFGNLNPKDWTLDALYNEPLRLRSYIANKLWLDIHTPYYIEDQPEAKAGTDLRYVEMFLNGTYNGLYSLSEQVHEKLLKLDHLKKKKVRGELFKAISWDASSFYEIPSYNTTSNQWGGFEKKYPKADDLTGWKNIYAFKDFVLNASDKDFKDNIWSRFHPNSFLDYYIFTNLLRAKENSGKNYYLAKYTSKEPYFYVPGDMDGCFGIIENGENENITNAILTNGFFERVIALAPNNYNKVIANRWFEYKATILNEDNLVRNIKNQYEYLSDYKVYERENLVYKNCTNREQDLVYMVNWLRNRISFLDTYFGNILYSNGDPLNNSEQLLYAEQENNKIKVTKLNVLTEND